MPNDERNPAQFLCIFPAASQQLYGLTAMAANCCNSPVMNAA
jgi:hypothetical protein